MLDQMMEILNNMEEDGNVKALKALVNAMKQESRIYFLEYKGKKLQYTINEHNADFSNGSTIELCVNGDAIWSTDDLITAVYAKYINTPWFNSSMETPTHDSIKAEDIKVVDNYGKVYNQKPLTNKTIAILYAKIRNDKGLLRECRDEKWANTYWSSLYDQKEILKEMKERYQKNKIKIQARLKEQQ